MKTHLLLAMAIIVVLAGCGYQQPSLDQPYGILHPVGSLKIVKVDDDNVITFSGDYVLRTSPGSHLLTLNYASNQKTPVEGTSSYLGQMKLEVKAGIRYYLASEYIYEKGDAFTLFVKKIKAWKPVLKETKPIENYSKFPGEKKEDSHHEGVKTNANSHN